MQSTMIWSYLVYSALHQLILQKKSEVLKMGYHIMVNLLADRTKLVR
ncbi:hypothetical protein PAECIP111894_00969 [Paenibacillus pseudetheri]|uniref:Uncharacterized protein n=1 Tax=Paenibacillus pseudetheri TaxID=2897682 RepID=A0ABN8FAV1_9BACL|nr:hypothetical protein PAECIP111894_00969 [Paenibacillus pseudetheri]